MERIITNNYDIAHKRPKLCTETRTIWEPVKGWSFSHSPEITWFKGRFYLMWNNGHVNEDDVGQRVLYSFSQDYETWSEPRELVPPRMGDTHEVVYGGGGFHVAGDVMVAYFGQYEYVDEWIEDGHRKPGNSGHKNHAVHYRTTTDGENWSEPVFIARNIGVNHAPKPLRSGRLLISGSNYYPYSDEPDGIHGWKMAGIYPEGFDTETVADDSEGIERITKLLNRPVTLCEGSFYQLDDGTIHMMLRSGTDFLWCTKSRDNGGSWSDPQPTKFTDNRTKFQFDRLPNGRFYYVGTPDPFPPRTRHVLVLSTSDDGYSFDRHYLLQDAQFKQKFIGLDKNGIYGYPSTVVHKGCLYVTVSVCKERIIVMRVPCDTL